MSTSTQFRGVKTWQKQGKLIMSESETIDEAQINGDWIKGQSVPVEQ